MKTVTRIASMMTLVALPLLAFTGCEKKNSDTDESVEKIGERVEESNEELRNALNP